MEQLLVEAEKKIQKQVPNINLEGRSVSGASDPLRGFVWIPKELNETVEESD